jgi:hypothetical protein
LRPIIVRSLVIVAAVGAALAPLPATVIERWYSRGLYPRLQPVVTRFSSLAPVALLDVAVGVLLTVAAIALVRRFRASSVTVWLGQVILSGAVLAAALYLWFLLFWGLHYRRVPLERRLAHDPSRISRAEALKVGRVAVAQANLLAPLSRSPDNEDQALSASLAELERKLGAPGSVLVAQPKRSLLTWYFRKAAIDGMTDPFFLEIIVSPDLLPFERPQTLAHEWAHLAGYADESEANFIAWLTCIRGTPLARYSGWLTAYQHLAGVLSREERQALRAGLSPAVVADLDAIHRRLSRASPRISSAARGAYDTYLRANRVEEGIASYDAVVRLILGAGPEHGWAPRARPR